MEPTPFYADKSFWAIVAGIATPFIARYLKIDVSPADFASIAVMVGAYVVASKNKQAKIAVAVAENPAAPPCPEVKP